MVLETISESRCFGGVQGVYSHAAAQTACTMRFSVYRPPQAETGPVPVLYWLSGLTCTEENFTVKAGAQRYAAEYGVMVVAPDTSPRGVDIPSEDESYDFGSGAGFYVDATEAPWSAHYRMYSYVTAELPGLILENFPGDAARQGIFGHSMGGHGALVCALRNPDLYKSVSAFAPIVAPTQVPWGRKAFAGYLGPDETGWRQYDACELIRAGARTPEILVDQGTADGFLAEQLKPELLREVCEAAGQPLHLRMQEGYDHSYYFIASFIGDHIAHHANFLKA
jgi:S-formylglutathione hydrolase